MIGRISWGGLGDGGRDEEGIVANDEREGGVWRDERMDGRMMGE